MCDHLLFYVKSYCFVQLVFVIRYFWNRHIRAFLTKYYKYFISISLGISTLKRRRRARKKFSVLKSRKICWSLKNKRYGAPFHTLYIMKCILPCNTSSRNNISHFSVEDNMFNALESENNSLIMWLNKTTYIV